MVVPVVVLRLRPPARRLLLAAGLGLRALAIDQLHERDLGGVALPDAELDDARVAARRAAKRGAISSKSFFTTARLRITAARDGARASVPCLPSVIIRSASRSISFAFASVVRMRLVLEQRRHEVAEERATVRGDRLSLRPATW